MEQQLDDYLENGIDYSANTIIKADDEDLKQLASDSFETGWNECNKELEAKVESQRDEINSLNQYIADKLRNALKKIEE